MSESGSVGAGVSAILVVLLFCGFVTYLFVASPDIGSGAYVQGTQNSAGDDKPSTKTRCGFGAFSSQIIEEERKNGYKFAGRVNSLLCGEDGLSFYLEKEDEQRFNK